MSEDAREQMLAHMREQMAARMHQSMEQTLTPAVWELLIDEAEESAHSTTTMTLPLVAAPVLPQSVDISRDLATRLLTIIDNDQLNEFMKAMPLLPHVDLLVSGEPLLFRVVAKNRAAMALNLLHLGASVHTKTNSAETVTHAAVRGESSDLLEIVLARGAPVDAPSLHDVTPLQEAYARLDRDYLQPRGGVLGRFMAARGRNGGVPPGEAKLRRIIAILVYSGANPNQDIIGGSTPLLHAIEHSDATMFDVLRSSSSSVKLNLQLQSRNGHTPLCCAISSRSGVSVAALLKAGAEPNVQCDFAFKLDSGSGETLLVNGPRHTPLFTAAYKSAYDSMHELLAHGARAECSDNSPLLACADAAPLHIVQALIATNDDLTARQDPHGRTALHIALLSGNTAAAQQLIAVGASIICHDYSNEMPLDYLQYAHGIALAKAASDQHVDARERLPTMLSDAETRRFYEHQTSLRGNHPTAQINEVYACLKWQALKRRIFDVCTALQAHALPTLMLLLIIDNMVEFAGELRMAAKWDAIVVVRHYHDRLRAETARVQAAQTATG